jgi:hypothetical protein
MAILIEGCCVVRVSAIAEKYPGGMGAYRRDCPNATCLADDHLCRVGLVATEGADVFAAELAGKGLTPFRDGTAEDVAVVRRPPSRRAPRRLDAGGPCGPAARRPLPVTHGVRREGAARCDLG